MATKKRGTAGGRPPNDPARGKGVIHFGLRLPLEMKEKLEAIVDDANATALKNGLSPVFTPMSLVREWLYEAIEDRFSRIKK